MLGQQDESRRELSTLKMVRSEGDPPKLVNEIESNLPEDVPLLGIQP